MFSCSMALGYAPTLFDCIRRAIALNGPRSLSNDEVYALTGHILNMNGSRPRTVSAHFDPAKRQSAA
jgi:hypothetical protein